MSAEDIEFSHPDKRLDYVSVDQIKLKDGMGYEALVAQLQGRIKKVLCVDDGIYLRIFEESGPFPLGVEFEHKQRRFGATEYFFRYARGTEEERTLCVFGRDNAEVFCPDYIDDQETESGSSSDDEFNQEKPLIEEDLLEDVFSTSSEASSETMEDYSIKEDVKNLLNEDKRDNEEIPEEEYTKPSEELKSTPKEELEENESLTEENDVLVEHKSLSPKIQVIEIASETEKESELQQTTYELS